MSAHAASAPVRVLHVLPSVSGYGAERLIVELLKRLSSPQVDAGLLTIYEPQAEQRADLPFALDHAGRKGVEDRLFLWRLRDAIRRRRPDIVHTHTHVGKYWGRAAAMLAGAPCIVHTEHSPCNPRRRNAAERMADRVLHRATSRVVTFFGDQIRRLSETERLPIEKLVAIPNGVTFGRVDRDRAAARRRLGIDDDRIALLLVGRMDDGKNHALALRALAALQSNAGREAALIFAGSGENEARLRDLAREVGVAARVSFLGYRDDVAQLLPGADLALMTSHYEGMPMALLEAMAAGVPVVTTPWLGARSMLDNGRCGLVATGYDPAQVAAAIDLAIEQPALRAGLARRAERFAREAYDLERMAHAHRALYTSLQKGRAS